MSSDRGSQWSSLGEVASDRIVYGGWDETVAASQAAAVMDSQIAELRPTESGIIYEICAYSAAATTGTGTFSLYINGVDTGAAVNLWGASEGECHTLYPEQEFVAGDLIEVYATTDGSWTPVRVRVVISMTPGGVAGSVTTDLFLVETAPDVYEVSTTGSADAVVTEPSAGLLVIDDDPAAADQVDFVLDTARNLFYLVTPGTPPYASYVHSLDPWGYYPVDAASVAPQDSSGNARNFTAGSEATATYPASLLPSGYGAAYAGSASSGGSTATWEITRGGFAWETWSISLWYQFTTAVDGYQPHLWLAEALAANGLYLRTVAGGGAVTARIMRGGNIAVESGNLSGRHHIVARCRNGAQSLWINGVSVATGTEGGTIGGSGIEGRSTYKGGFATVNTWRMDELILFNRYLEDVEVLGLYTNASL